MTICTPWRVANSLNQLLAQANAFAPNRAKGADGSIGDAAHQAEACASQHNSCCVKFNGIWIIRARDFTHDPAGGFDSYAFAEQLRLSRDPRIRYIISNHRITSASRNWLWEPYSGSDPHTNHAHVSVWDDPARFDDTSRAWRITAPAAATPQEVEMSTETFFSCNGANTGANAATKFFGVPGGLCTWIQSQAAADSLNMLEDGKWIDEIAAAHTDGAAPGIDRSLIHIVGKVPPGFEDCAAFTAPQVDMAGLKQAVVDAVKAAADDPSNDANLSPEAVLSVASAVVAQIGQKLGTVQA